MKNIKLTICTPTFNRAYILPVLYQSLQKQTCKDFEWLIIDDGSADNTQELAEAWITSDNDFPIRYYKKENAGKCSAINCGLDYANGELFVVIDSDDFLTEDAAEKIIALENTVSDKNKFCGVAFNLGTDINTTPNSLFDADYKDATLLNRYTSLDGEKAYAFYTEIHKKYRYPLFDNEKFMTEAVVWNRIANDGYLMRFSNDIICIYEYREDGLTNAGASLFINNPRGYGLWLKEKDIFMKKSFFEKIKTFYSFTCELKDKYNDSQIAECIGISTLSVKTFKLIHKIISLIKK